MIAKQLTFLEAGAAPTSKVGGRCRLDDESERLIEYYADARVEQGAHPRSIKREVGQIRTLAREAGTGDHPVALRALVDDVSAIARLLIEPAATIARTTGRARLVAIQRFIEIVGPRLGRTLTVDLAALDARLPARRAAGWHTTGAIVAGTSSRRRRRGPTLDAVNLHRIVNAAGTGCDSKSVRDRALVALLCFSGVRSEEVVRLRWNDIDSELTVDGRHGLVVSVIRRGRPVRLLLPAPAAEAIGALARALGGSMESLSGHVFTARGTSGRALGYRAARDIVRAACRGAGLPPVESISLRSACAHWLRVQGLSDHEVASVLGLARVSSVDRLLRGHAALDAQCTVREMIG